jgi:hypothetical protein
MILRPLPCRGRATRCACLVYCLLALTSINIVVPVHVRFHIYIHDYCSKRGYLKTARELVLEADIPQDSQPPINAKQGLLFEWWSVFWTLFTAKNNGQGPDEALLYTQVLVVFGIICSPRRPLFFFFASTKRIKTQYGSRAVVSHNSR